MSGLVYLSKGQFNLANQWLIANGNNIAIMGAGPGITIIKFNSYTGESFVIQVATANDISFEGFTVDGNQSGRSLNIETLTAETCNAIQVYNCLRFRATKVNVINSPEIGINLRGTTTDSVVENGYYYNNYGGSISLFGTTGNRIINNTVNGNNIQYAGVGAAGITGNTYSKAIIMGNTVYNAFDGITAGDGGGSDNIISDNLCYSCDRNGIAIFNGPIRSTISNNICYSNAGNGISHGTNATNNKISNNKCRSNTQRGINIYHTVDCEVHDNDCSDNTLDGIQISGVSTRVEIKDNVLRSNGGYGLLATDTDSSLVRVTDNYFFNNTSGKISYSDTVVSVIRDNLGFIAPGEIHTRFGSLTAGNANAIAFAWHNLEGEDILILKVIINITTGGGTVGSQLDVGIADDATGTNRGTEFFDDLLLNNAGADDSEAWSGHVGQQVAPVSCQDSASATDGWIVGQILTQNAASLVGTYHIEYCGA